MQHELQFCKFRKMFKILVLLSFRRSHHVWVGSGILVILSKEASSPLDVPQLEFLLPFSSSKVEWRCRSGWRNRFASLTLASNSLWEILKALSTVWFILDLKIESFENVQSSCSSDKISKKDNLSFQGSPHPRRQNSCSGTESYKRVHRNCYLLLPTLPSLLLFHCFCVLSVWYFILKCFHWNTMMQLYIQVNSNVSLQSHLQIYLKHAILRIYSQRG